ncbi:MAG: aminodeoxychorismate/anthranilate synthase component II [Planctomycetota bacterium]
MRKKTILLIDNYDSFTYNLVQAFGEIGVKLKVYRNDKITLEQARRLKPDGLVISPGPKSPKEAGISNVLIKYFYKRIPILGVCLGEQCLSYVFGGQVIRGGKPVHGKTSLVYHDGKTIFQGISNPFTAMRYHSLTVDRKTLPTQFEISATTADGVIMGIRMKDYPVEGVQFHPESYLTVAGKKLLKNFNSRIKLI